MNKNNVVIITTRWMSVIQDNEGEKRPIHCWDAFTFQKENISKADILSSFFKTHPSIQYYPEIACDGYYSLYESKDDINYKVFILPCLARPCPDPEDWIVALVNQFTESGDVVRMMLHASTDLGTGPQVISSIQSVNDRDLIIRAFSHMGADTASLILLSDIYKENHSASRVFEYLNNLCRNMSGPKKQFKDKWNDFIDLVISTDDLCSAYNTFLSVIGTDIRKSFLPSEEAFRQLADGVNKNEPDCFKKIEQIIQRF